MSVRIKYGIVIVCTLFGGLFGYLAYPDFDALDRVAVVACARIEYAIWGNLVGIIVDLTINGCPRRSDWRVSSLALILAMPAWAILVWGLLRFQQAINIQP